MNEWKCERSLSIRVNPNKGEPAVEVIDLTAGSYFLRIVERLLALLMTWLI